MEKVTLPEAAKGPWKIERFTTDRMDWHSAARGRAVPVGETYTKVTRNGYLVMSDTPAEQLDHVSAVRRATGSCLLNGLGIGMILKNILLKPEVTDVTVIELSQDLIDIVAPHYADPRVTIVCSDALTYQPPKGKKYQMVWHDIWDSICSDNLDGMKRLHRKYGRRTEWQGSWCNSECERGFRRANIWY